MKLRIYIFIVLTLLCATLHAQSNLRSKKIPTRGVITLDSLHIVPGSFVVTGFDTSYYMVNYAKSFIVWKKNTVADSAFITYRVLPFNLTAPYSRYSFDSIKNNFAVRPYTITRKTAAASNIIDFGKINYNGSFGRSLSFGNNQDAVFNSQLNLQLSGIIGDSIEIAAAITDNNIPIQPDGNTQQLNEFDRVWLQFKKKGWEVNLGDIDLRQNTMYFLNFYKRLQGISYSQTNKIGANGYNKALASGAIAKGKFTRNIITGQEGNQGPYRLQGANNELFFIVLAGTERVFIDGEPMQRGEDQDYVINYNTAEITFTPKRMINKDRRIQVEFEYADRNFLNSMFYVSNELQLNKKLKVQIAAYNNSDAKNSPINQTIGNAEKQFLNNIGDSIQYAFYPVAGIDTFSVSKILYKKVEVIYGTITDSIYVYSTNPDSAKYNLNFIEVGFGLGNYIPLYNAANGKVYQWIQPVNGVPQGNFEPATFLVTPKKQQVLSVAVEYAFNNTTLLRTEVGFSNYDVNLYSSKSNNDNTGFAGKFILQHKTPIIAKQKKMELTTTAGYEYVSEKFRPVERLRGVEFNRDWGLNIITTAADEHLPFVQASITDAKANTLQYTAGAYLRSDGYKAYRNIINHSHNINGWQLNNVFNLINDNTPVDKGYFLRPQLSIDKTFRQLFNYNIGASYIMEHNEQRNKLNDTITPLSFSFDVISAYIKSDQRKNNNWQLSYFTRNDKLPIGKDLQQSSRSHNYSFLLALLKNAKHQVRSTVTYRQLKVSNSAVLQPTNLVNENSLLGRVEYVVNEMKGFITGNSLYEVGSGQEPRRDFTYIEVPPGRGEFAWNDYNNDGIPQLNEFEIALYPDQAKYIRIFTPTNQFVKANYTQFNYSLTLNPRALSAKIKNKKIGAFITRFTLQSSLQTGKKVLSNGAPQVNPFKGEIQDTSLLSLNNSFNNTLSYNRFSSVWGIDVSRLANYNKNLLTYGFESRQLKEWTMRGRLTLKRAYTVELIQKLGENNLFTPKFDNRNYTLTTMHTEPRLTYTYQTKYRLQAAYILTSKQNSIAYGGEKSTSNSLAFEGKYNAVQSTSITGRFTLSNIKYNSLANTTISYIMLDGLLPGKNYLWSVDLTKRLINNLELTIQYEGRKPAETRTIHIGRAGLRALL